MANPFFKKILTQLGLVERSELDSVSKQVTELKKKASTPVSMSIGGAFGAPAEAPRKTSDYLQLYSGWVFACVKARAQDVSYMRLRLFRQKDDDVKEVDEHDALSLMYTANPWMTGRDLLRYTQSYKDLTGEAFWYLVKSGGRIAEIWLLRPDWMTIRTDAKKHIAGYTYQIPGSEPIMFDTDEIIHFKTFNPIEPYRGLSVVRAAAASIDSENFAEDYNRRFFKNSAIPAVVLSTDARLDETLNNRMKAAWMQEYGGVERAHKVAILEGGLTATPFSISHKDAEFLAGMGFNRDKILALFEVPKTRLGMTENVTVSNAEATDMIYLKHVIKPLMDDIADYLNEFLLPQMPESDGLFFTVDDPTTQSVEQRMVMYKTLYDTGAMSPNEIREREGMDAVPGLDYFFISNAGMPIVDGVVPENGEPSEPTKRIVAPLVKRLPMRRPKSMHRKIKEEMADSVTNKVMNAIRPQSIKSLDVATNGMAKSTIPYERQEQYWRDTTDKAVSFEKQYKRGIVATLDRQERETVSRLEKSQKTVKELTQSDIADVLFDLKIEGKVVAEILLPILNDYIAEAGQDALDLVGVDEAFDTTTATVRQFMSGRALRGIRSMNRTTRGILRTILVNAVESGSSIPEVSRSIRASFENMKKTRADIIARTEIMRSTHMATIEAYKQSGVVVGKQWFTALDERVCQWCGQMTQKDGMGVVMPIEEDFFDRGSKFVGANGGVLSLDFENVQAPPLHPGCRCTLIPVTISQRRAATKPETKEVVIDTDAIKDQLREELKPEIDEQVKAGVDAEIGKIVDELEKP